ncbi:MAG: FAD-binding protein [Bacillota bacterium]|nr:FAD-binding protein [Bacillota bacterium]MDW7684303.1 FAD-binding protein [Bacillota bacterium]
MPKRRTNSSWRVFYTAILLAAAGFLLAQYSLRRETPVYPALPKSVDVIVLGSGLTGAAVVHAASQWGVDVFYIDLGEPDAGGFPAFSPAYWAAETQAQKDADIEYSAENMALDLYNQGGEAGNISLILRFSAESGSHLAWLEEVTDTEFTISEVPNDNPGLHSPAGAAAENVVMPALTADLTRLTTRYSQSVKPQRLLLDEDGIFGMTVQNESGEQEDIYTRSVVLADGGYASSPDMLAEYAGITDTVSRPEGGHNGLGLQLALEAGASTLHLNRASVMPVFLPEGRRIDETTLTEAILLGAGGDPVLPADSLTETIRAAGGRLFILYGDNNAPENSNFTRIDSLGALAAGLGIGREKAEEMTAGIDPPYHVAVAGLIALTPGGLVVDEQYRVMRQETPIPGLYAAGEITAGLHGQESIAALSFSEGVISGRIAGGEAAGWARR